MYIDSEYSYLWTYFLRAHVWACGGGEEEREREGKGEGREESGREKDCRKLVVP